MLVVLPFILGMVVPVVFRREYPVAAFVAVMVNGALQVLLLRRPTGADLAVLIVLYTLATSGWWRGAGTSPGRRTRTPAAATRR